MDSHQQSATWEEGNSLAYSNTAAGLRTPAGQIRKCGDCRYVDALVDESLGGIEVSRLDNGGKGRLNR